MNLHGLSSADFSVDYWQFAARPIVFMRPAYTAKSGWHEHVPFAFWLIEALRPRCVVELGTHYGISYFAFCQAVKALKLDTSCYAIDTWKGDEHAGFYDETVYQAVERENNAQYSLFSRLVRSRFEDAQGYFSDGQIDLLHIDGHHSLESVRSDFDVWLPKLSERAVVLLHDTNVRERGFGVHRFFDEVKDTYPSFEFLHGHGLGLLAVGKEAAPQIQRLLEFSKQAEFCQLFKELFSRVGRACDDAYWATHQLSEVSKLRKIAESQKSEIDNQVNKLSEVERALSEERGLQQKYSDEFRKFEANIGTLRKQIEVKDVELLWERTSRESDKARLNDLSTSLEVSRRQMAVSERCVVEEKQRRLDAEERELSRGQEFHQILSTRDAEISVMREELSICNDQLNSGKESLESSMIEGNELRLTLAKFQQMNEDLRAQLDVALDEIANLQGRLLSVMEEQKALEGALEATKNQGDERELVVAKLSEEVELKSIRLGEKRARIERFEASEKELKEVNAVNLARAAMLEENLRERFEEIAKLTMTLREQDEVLGKIKYLKLEAARQLGQVISLSIATRNGKNLFGNRFCKALGAQLSRARLFDEAWYLEAYPDILRAGVDPMLHYIKYGANEGRRPNGALDGILSSDEGTKSGKS